MNTLINFILWPFCWLDKHNPNSIGRFRGQLVCCCKRCGKLLTCLLLMVLLFVSVSQAGESRYVTTPPDVVVAMLDAAAVIITDTVVDLGCGDGRIPIIAAAKYGVRAIGVELDSEIATIAKQNVKRNNLDHLVDIRQGDILQMKWGESRQVVTVYLDPELLQRLRPVFDKLPIGSRIVSYQHPLFGYSQGKVIELFGHRLYRYRVIQKIRKQKVCGPRGCTYVDVAYKVIEGF
ncbi:hypothetical protein LCGC14_0248890 [marine sediment metagenome]|uniref:Methyltransferase domain-containing protein n=1 Tax=marine sediment metagenome TaxID=412755 RepID=A0A0F9ULK9_9ZZZZ